MKPFPGSENPVNPPALLFILKQEDPEFDDFVVIGVSAGGFDIHNGGDALWAVIGLMVFGQRA